MCFYSKDKVRGTFAGCAGQEREAGIFLWMGGRGGWVRGRDSCELLCSLSGLIVQPHHVTGHLSFSVFIHARYPPGSFNKESLR